MANAHGDQTNAQTQTFSGDIKPTTKFDVPIHVFLKQVNLFRDSEQLTDDELLSHIVHLLHGTARSWYSNTAHLCHSWEEFVAAFKDAFLPPEYDSLLLMEAEQRKQGRDEPVAAFINDMDTKFRAMANPVNKLHQVCIVKRNLLPYFAITLGLADPQSITECARESKRQRQYSEIVTRTLQSKRKATKNPQYVE